MARRIPTVTPAKLINSTRTCNDQRPQQSLVEPNRTQWHGCKRTQAVHIWNFTIDKDRREIAGIGGTLCVDGNEVGDDDDGDVDEVTNQKEPADELCAFLLGLLCFLCC